MDPIHAHMHTFAGCVPISEQARGSRNVGHMSHPPAMRHMPSNPDLSSYNLMRVKQLLSLYFKLVDRL